MVMAQNRILNVCTTAVHDHNLEEIILLEVRNAFMVNKSDILVVSRPKKASRRYGRPGPISNLVLWPRYKITTHPLVMDNYLIYYPNPS